jgi:hypothetical protein
VDREDQAVNSTKPARLLSLRHDFCRWRQLRAEAANRLQHDRLQSFAAGLHIVDNACASAGPRISSGDRGVEDSLFFRSMGKELADLIGHVDPFQATCSARSMAMRLG